jgi:hypothetical protein
MIPFPIAAMIVLAPLIVIVALVMAVSDRLRLRKPMTRPRGLLGKAYRPTFILIGVGGLVIFALVMAL